MHDVYFADLRYGFSKWWNMMARIAFEDRNCLLILCATYLSFCAVFVGMLVVVLERLSHIESLRDLYILCALLFLDLVVVLYHVDIIWQWGAVPHMFDEALHCVQRRHATRCYPTKGDVDPLQFFEYCTSNVTRACHPMGYSVAGITLTKNLGIRVVYLTLYVSIGVSVRFVFFSEGLKFLRGGFYSSLCVVVCQDFACSGWQWHWSVPAEVPPACRICSTSIVSWSFGYTKA